MAGDPGVVLVDVEVAVQAEELRVRAEEALRVRLAREHVPALFFERGEVALADADRLVDVGRAQAPPGPGLPEAVTDLEHPVWIVANAVEKRQGPVETMWITRAGTGLENWFQHMTLPVVALALSFIGICSRYVRSSIMVTLGQPYVTVARGKGLSEGQVLIRYVLRNSLIPFTSLLSLEVGGLIGPSLAADAVFGLGGLASVFLGAVNSSDPFELTALFVVTAAVVSVFALLGDVLVGLLDPRVRVAMAQ